MYMYILCPSVQPKRAAKQLHWNLNWILVSASPHSGIEGPADRVVISRCWQWSVLPNQKIWCLDSSTNQIKLSLTTSLLSLFATGLFFARDRVTFANAFRPECHSKTYPNISLCQNQKSNKTNITGHGLRQATPSPQQPGHAPMRPMDWSAMARWHLASDLPGKGWKAGNATMQICNDVRLMENVVMGGLMQLKKNMQLDIVGQFQTWTLFHTNSHLEVRAGCRPLRRLNCLWNVKTFRAKYDPHTGASIRAIRAFDRKTDTVSQVLWHLKPRDVCSLQLCKRSLGPMSPLLLLSHGLTSWLRCTCNFSPRLPNLRLWAGLCHWAHLSLATCGSHRLSSFRRSSLGSFRRSSRTAQSRSPPSTTFLCGLLFFLLHLFRFFIIFSLKQVNHFPKL